jgi:glycerophosphoryl diester phosphodiesterase
MKHTKFAMFTFLMGVLLLGLALTASTFAKDSMPKGKSFGWKGDRGHSIQLGPRPYYLVEDMDESDLKNALQKCSEGPFKRTDFSIGHRGAALQFLSIQKNPTSRQIEWEQELLSAT